MEDDEHRLRRRHSFELLSRAVGRTIVDMMISFLTGDACIACESFIQVRHLVVRARS